MMLGKVSCQKKVFNFEMSTIVNYNAVYQLQENVIFSYFNFANLAYRK